MVSCKISRRLEQAVHGQLDADQLLKLQSHWQMKAEADHLARRQNFRCHEHQNDRGIRVLLTLPPPPLLAIKNPLAHLSGESLSNL
jgi:hypothetical protein